MTACSCAKETWSLLVPSSNGYPVLTMPFAFCIINTWYSSNIGGHGRGTRKGGLLGVSAWSKKYVRICWQKLIEGSQFLWSFVTVSRTILSLLGWKLPDNYLWVGWRSRAGRPESRIGFRSPLKHFTAVFTSTFQIIYMWINTEKREILATSRNN